MSHEVEIKEKLNELGIIAENVKMYKSPVNFDWLNITFHNVDPEVILNIFCDSVEDENVKESNFLKLERGIVPGYNQSFSYMGTPYIVIASNPEHCQMGVNLQITGTGLNLVTYKDILKFMNHFVNSNVTFKCTRMDLSFDDYDKIIPVDLIVENTIHELDPLQETKTLVSRVKRNNISIRSNKFNGQLTQNIDFGKGSGVKKIRLYDKRCEQQRIDLKYWYRMEIQMRSTSHSPIAQNRFLEFLNGKSKEDIYLEELFQIINFSNPVTNPSACAMALWWREFKEKIENLLRIIHNNEPENYNYNIYENNCQAPTPRNLFQNTYYYFLKQYGSFMLLLNKLDTDIFNRLNSYLRRSVRVKEKYLLYYENFKNLNKIELDTMLYNDFFSRNKLVTI